VPRPIIDNPILNSPFLAPTRHWALDDSGVPTGIPAEGRRRSEFIVPVPPSKHKQAGQGSLDLDDSWGAPLSNDYINAIRSKVADWRGLGNAGLDRTVTPVTARLLRYWRAPDRQRRLFFCQVKAAEHYGDEAMRVFKVA
jgi:type III restriction enzyme